MILGYTVNWDTDRGLDYDESYQTLREARRRYDALENVPYKSLTYDDTERGTMTLLNSKGVDNLRRYGFLPCDWT